MSNQAYYCDECEYLIFFEEDIQECLSEGHELEELKPSNTFLLVD